MIISGNGCYISRRICMELIKTIELKCGQALEAFKNELKNK